MDHDLKDRLPPVPSHALRSGRRMAILAVFVLIVAATVASFYYYWYRTPIVSTASAKGVTR
jgi:hypothetical protein